MTDAEIDAKVKAALQKVNGGINECLGEMMRLTRLSPAQIVKSMMRMEEGKHEIPQ